MIQRETRRAVLVFAAIGMALCVLVTVLYGLMRRDWLNGLLAGITLAMANLPEEFPVVLTVFLALGAWRISQHGVLTRRAPAIETLGSTTVLCVDKTGTLTQNRMAVRAFGCRAPIQSICKPSRARFCRTSSNSASWQANGSPSIRWRRPTTGSRRSARPRQSRNSAHRRSRIATRYPRTVVRCPCLATARKRWVRGGGQRRPGGDRRAVRARRRPTCRHPCASRQDGRRRPARACSGTRDAVADPGEHLSVALVAKRAATAVRGPHRTRRPHSADRAGSLEGMLQRWNTHGDDHRRLPRHRGGHRTADRPRGSGNGRDRARARRHDRCATARSGGAGQHLRAGRARAEVAAGASAQSQRRNRGDDWRWGQ